MRFFGYTSFGAFLRHNLGMQTYYSDIPDFEKEVAKQRRRMEIEKVICGRYLFSHEQEEFWKDDTADRRQWRG